MLKLDTLSPDLAKQYAEINTPFLFVNKSTFNKNLAQLRQKITNLGAQLRPHFKTVKSLKAAEHMLPTLASPITVSTLKEAEALATVGYSNILYAVAITEQKLARVKKLMALQAKVTVLVDHIEQAKTLTAFCAAHNLIIPALVEIDCDGHRGGIPPQGDDLLAIAHELNRGKAHFAGLLCHAGESYHCFEHDSLQLSADNEVDTVRLAVAKLKSHDIHCEVVSIGSTPTAYRYRDLTGITEVRAGVYSFFDLAMAGLEICQYSDIAAHVVATVIGHNKDKGWVLLDAGWMALSADRSTEKHPMDCGYGLIVNSDGNVHPNVKVVAVNQEHGILTTDQGNDIDFATFPIGSRVHILPNHACATASMHQCYHVFDWQGQTYDTWYRIQGW